MNLLDDTSQEDDIFRWARETANPSEIVPAFVDWLMVSPTAERVQELHGRIGDEGVAIIARAVFENLMNSEGSDERDFAGFTHRFEQLPQTFSQALFGSHYQKLKDIGTVSEALSAK